MNLKEYFKKHELDNSMVRIDAQPHTKDIEALTSCCSGPVTGEYYFCAKYFDEDIEYEAILSELAKLQDTNPDNWTYGCLKWYREEPVIRDTNGAFFVLRYIACALCCFPERISQAERDIIIPVLEKAAVWFERECFGHGYFYPNKIMSDGGLLMLIGMVTANDAIIEKARNFWNGWLSYTKNYGWGWGENTSRCYTTIMIDALNFALICLDKNDELYKELLKMRNHLIDYCAYHEDFEFIPSIRTYNFDGKTLGKDSTKVPNVPIEILKTLTPKHTPTPSENIFHREKIFENSYATTYKGENIRLGTINKFPVMPGCYQNPDWGLGWQSMPVSVLAKNHETGFLRFITQSDEKTYAHPAENHHSAYLMNRLFKEEHIPECFTVSNQQQNTAVVVRGMYNVANSASFIADEWYFQHFDGEFLEYKDWYVLNYGDCVFAIKSLSQPTKITQDGEKIRISQVMHDGDEKLVTKRKWLSCWAVCALDSAVNYKAELDKISVTYEEVTDLRYPRQIRPILLSCGDAKLSFDPDFDI